MARKKEDIIKDIQALNVPGIGNIEALTVENLLNLEGLLTSGDKITELETKNKDLTAKVGELTAEIDSKDKAILDVNAELQQAKSTIDGNDITRPVITVGGKKFQVISGGRIKEDAGVREFKIEDVVKDKALQEHLVKSGSGCLVAIK